MSRLLPILAAGEPSFTPSLYSPSQVVEIAFTATYATPAADRVWTDVTDYVELHDKIDITVGRQDERSTADANDLTLTLDNSDGRFTALRAASPYYPNVKIGRPIRVSVTTVTGVAFIRFVGFIDQWPVEWDGTDAYAKATIRATSRLSRLGLTAKLRSLIEQEILAKSPAAYWTLGDPAGSTSASESSGHGVSPLTSAGSGTAVVFGNAVGPSTDGLTAAEFANGQYLISGGVGVTDCAAIRVTIQVSALPPSITTVIAATNGESIAFVELSNTGALFATVTGGAPDFGTATLPADGSVHDIALVHVPAASAWHLYVDGVSVGSGGPATALTGTGNFVVRVGGSDGAGFTGALSHAAVYTATLSATEVTDQWEAVSAGFAGDTTDERLLRILSWAGVAATEVDAESGAETMTYQLTAGMSAVDALREVESTEGGVLFDGPDGNVVFHNRSRRYTATPAVTLDMESQHVGADYAPRLDRSTLVNDVTVENPTTGETARAVDTNSRDEYGVATGSLSSLSESFDLLGPQKAAWQVASYAEPQIRAPSLTVDVLAHVGKTPSAEDLLGVTVGSLIAVTNAPTQSDTTSPSYFVEGYSETIGPESYGITFNLSPTYPTLNVLILDDATRGRLDEGNVLAY